MGDEELAERLYDKFYANSGRSRDEVFSRLGVKTGPVDFSLKKTISNIPSSAAKYAGDIASAVMNPIDTARSIGGLAQSVGNKIGRNAAEFIHGQEMDTLPEYSEDAANAVGGAIKGRYGSLDAVKSTLMNDPVGALADVSGLGMASKVPGVARIAAAAEPLNIASKGVKAAAKAIIPERMAQNLYQSAAKFSTTLKPEQRAQIVQTALDYGVMPTSKGVAKVEGRLGILNAHLDDLIETATSSGQKIPVNAVFQHLAELRKTKGGVRLGNDSDLAAIDKIAGEFHRSMKKRGKSELTPKELQAFKVSAYKDINWDAKRMTGTPIKEDAYKSMARGAKDAISQAVPEANEINKLLGELYELQPHLSRSASRIDNRNPIGLTTPINVGAGGYLGSVADSAGLGVAAGVVASALNNPKMQARIAIALNKMKQGDVKWLENNMHLAETRIALSLAGRNEEMTSDLQASQ